ncbi:MAG: Txe/YoeB family addiction module toxin [Holosporales bacterium]|nr:Txe/YoeB family addiction module toxin [Holosporales bacterium]
MVGWKVIYTQRAQSDSLKLKAAGLKEKTIKLLDIILENPFTSPPHFEKLIGFDNVYSRRINIKHRLVYEIIKSENTIKILTMWTHYE